MDIFFVHKKNINSFAVFYKKSYDITRNKLILIISWKKKLTATMKPTRPH